MNAFSSLSRRSLLRWLLYPSALSFFLPARLLAERLAFSSNDLLALRLVRVFTSEKSARRVGSEYLRRAPEEADLSRLVDRIASTHPQRRAQLEQASVTELRELLNQELREDFALGRTIDVSGWVLSQTEVRLCALAALL